MTEAMIMIKTTLVSAVLATADCFGPSAPTAHSVAGLSPSGNATIAGDFVTGFGRGSGTLDFQGRSYPFKVAGTVVGSGGRVEKISASGSVCKLSSVADFFGRYTQSDGAAGLSTSRGSDLWPQNNVGVIIHLQGTAKRSFCGELSSDLVGMSRMRAGREGIRWMSAKGSLGSPGAWPRSLLGL